MAGNAVQIVVAAFQGHADEANELLVAAGEMLAQPEQALPVLAERVQAYRDRPAIRPERLVALKLDGLVFPVTGGVAAK